jgi:exoribonuclease R
MFLLSPKLDTVVFCIDQSSHGIADDGISLGKVEGEGRWVHVCVSDVPEYIAIDSELELSARARPQSVYLGGLQAMFYNKPSLFLSVSRKSDRDIPIVVLVFSALVHQQTGAVMKYGVSLGQIPVPNLKLLSFAEANRLLVSDNTAQFCTELKELYRLSTLFSDYRGEGIQSEAYLTPTSVVNQSDDVTFVAKISGDAFGMIKEYMLLACLISGNIGYHANLPLSYRLNVQPILFSSLTEKQVKLPRKPLCVKRDFTEYQESISCSHPINFNIFCQVTSPIRRLLDYYVGAQFKFYLKNKPLLSASFWDAAIDNSKRFSGVCVTFP